jgi:hypothetical protein
MHGRGRGTARNFHSLFYCVISGMKKNKVGIMQFLKAYQNQMKIAQKILK